MSDTLRAVLPSMLERRAGRIITIASMGGRSGSPSLGHYAAAKWGVIGLAKTLRAAVLYLASDAARAVSGITLEVGSGVSARLP